MNEIYTYGLGALSVFLLVHNHNLRRRVRELKHCLTILDHRDVAEGVGRHRLTRPSEDPAPDAPEKWRRWGER